jgi:hypothetical protein
MLDQLIRKHVQRYLNETTIISEDTVNIETRSGWNFEIPSANSLRGQKAQRIAVANGAFTGLMIIANRRRYQFFGYDNKDKKTFNDAELDNDVKKMFDAIARRDFPNKYDPEKTLFVYVKAVDKKYKKIWNVWAFDKQEIGINDIVKNWKTALQQSTYFERSKLEIDRIQSISLMSYSQAEKWFSSLEKAKRDFKIDTKIKLPNLSAIKTADDTDDNTLESQTIRVDADENVFDSKGQRIINVNTFGFSDGIAELRPAPDGESVLFIPVNGTLLISERRTGRPGTFRGEFKDGAPFEGTVTYKTANDNEIKIFVGEVSSKISTEDGLQNFEFDTINGRATYGNGVVFDGEFKNNNRWNGEVFNNKGQALGAVKDGEYSRGLKYPLDWQTKTGAITVYDGGNKVFMNSADNSWGELDKTYFENEAFFSEDISNIAPIDDANRIRKLNKEFKGLVSYIRIKTSPIDLYTLNGTDFVLTYQGLPVNLTDTNETDFVFKQEKLDYYLITVENTDFWIPSKFIDIVEK